MLSLGENLARIRTARGLTQEELAQASGVSVDTISRLERGAHATARRSTLAALSLALGIDPGRLLGIAPPEQDTAGAEQLRRAVHALDLPDFAEPAEVLALVDDQAAQAAGLLARPDGDRIGVFGSLLFNAVSAAARQGAPDRADDLLRAATAAAARSGIDRVDETGVFGPRVAAMQAVDQAMRTGDPDQAVQRATQVPDMAGAVPAFWGVRAPAAPGRGLRRPGAVGRRRRAPRGCPGAGAAVVAGAATGSYRRWAARRAPGPPLRAHRSADRALRG